MFLRFFFLTVLLQLSLCNCGGTIYTPTTISHKFSPEPDVEEATRKALARWVAATGIGLAVQKYGTVISVQDGWVIDYDGEKQCGFTFSLENRILVSRQKERCDYWSFDSLVLHEIGHMITFSDGHAESGIMAAGGPTKNRECIDENSLILICSGTYCPIFEPEC